MRFHRTVAVLSSLAVMLAAGTAYAWTGPTGAAPSNNTPPPINEGSSPQIKSGFLQIDNSGGDSNSLSVVGNAILTGSNRYLNFGSTWGVNGYGMRDNAGTIEFKNSGDTEWSSLQSLILQYCGASCGGSSLWIKNGSSVYYNGGNVGIGTSNPTQSLDIQNGSIVFHTSSSGTYWTSDPTGAGITGGSSGLDFIAGNSVRAVVNSSGNVGIDTTNPRSALEVNGGIINTNAYNANTNLASYDVGVGSIGAGSSIYSYGSICTGNTSGSCNGSLGVVVGTTNTSAKVNIPSTGTTFFNGGRVGIGTASPNAWLEITNVPSSTWGETVYSPTYGIFGQGGTYGVEGNASSASGIGVLGEHSGNGYGVYGYAAASGGVGVRGDGNAYGGQFYNTSSGAQAELAYGSYGLYTGNNVYANDYYDAAIGMWLSSLRTSQQMGGEYEVLSTTGYYENYYPSYDCGSGGVMEGVILGDGACIQQGYDNSGCVQYSTEVVGIICRTILH